MMEYKQDHIHMSFNRQAFKFPENMIPNVKANLINEIITEILTHE